MAIKQEQQLAATAAASSSRDMEERKKARQGERKKERKKERKNDFSTNILIHLYTYYPNLNSGGSISDCLVKCQV